MRRLPRHWLALGLLAAAGALAQAPPPPPAPAGALAAGIAALQSGALEQAEAQLAAVAAGGGPDAGTAQFYLGLSAQTRADRAATPAQRRAALTRARAAYEAAATALPDSGATLNNLARVLAALGEAPAANAALDRAVALKDGKQSAYLRTRADIAAAADGAGAVDALHAALLASPEDAALRTRFVTRALATAPARLASTAEALTRQGDVRASEALIVAALADARAPREALLLALADARAGQRYAPASFLATSTAMRLRELGNDPVLGPCVAEFLSLHAKPVGTRSAYRWWTRDYSEYEPPRPGTRAARWRALAQALAASARADGTDKALRAAQPYAELALDLSGTDVDPKAVLELADIYANTDQLEQLRAMSHANVRRLFMGKGGAYASNDLPKIYDYHLALGTIFGYLNEWGSSGKPDSAIFQLEHARSVAQRINTQSGNPRAVVVPPTTVGLLSDAYVAVNRPDDGVKVRLDAAGVYRAQQRPAFEAAVLDAPPEKLRPALERATESTRVRWAEYRPLPPGVAVVPPVEAPPVHLKEVLVPAPNDVTPIGPKAIVAQVAKVAKVATMGALRPNVNLPGGDLPDTGTRVGSAADCAEACRTRTDCRAMTFVAAPPGGICWLKGVVPAASAAYGMTSAEKAP